MEATFPQLVTVEPSTASMGWLRVLIRALRKLTLSPEERELLAKVKSAAESVGAGVLEATTRDDLSQRLDRAADSAALDALYEAVPPSRVPDLLKRMATEPDPYESDERVDRVLGPGPRLTFAQGALFARHTAAGLQPLIAAGPRPASAAPIAMRDLIRNDRVPVRAREIFLDQLRASAAMLGIVRAVETEQPLAPWLAQALCEVFATGQRAFLRLVAGVPGTHVTESVLPRNEWVFLADLDAEQRAWEARVEQLPHHDDGPPGDG